MTTVGIDISIDAMTNFMNAISIHCMILSNLACLKFKKEDGFHLNCYGIDTYCMQKLNDVYYHN